MGRWKGPADNATAHLAVRVVNAMIPHLDSAPLSGIARFGEEDLRLPSLPSRLGARLLDGVIVLVLVCLWVLPQAALLLLAFSGEPPEPPSWLARLTTLVLVPLIWGTYETVLVGRFGTTYGKAILGTRVVEAAELDSPVGYSTAFARWLVPGMLLCSVLPIEAIGATDQVLPASWLIIAALGGWLAIATNRFRQGLNDMAAGTLVLSADTRRLEAVKALPSRSFFLTPLVLVALLAVVNVFVSLT